MPYPPPHIPIRPVLEKALFSPVQYFTDAEEDTYYLTSARAGIALALRENNFSPGSEVLLPAYHCVAMVEPVVLCGLKPIFYRINADCSVNIKDLEEKLTDTSCALIVTHYFGFFQSFDKIKEICAKKGMILIEDSAHVLYRKEALSAADYTVWSAMKFFPVYEGGLLKVNSGTSRKFELESAGFAFQLKSFLNNLEYSFRYNRLKGLKWIWSFFDRLKSCLWSSVKKVRGSNGVATPSAADGGYGMEEAWVSKKMSFFSRLAVKCSLADEIVRRRRHNYLQIYDRLKSLPGGHPLFQALPENVAPYVFPFVVDDPEAVFPLLKDRGVPIVRFGEEIWPGVDESVCSVSADLSKRVFQFPCHQNLRQDEIEWMLDEISAVFQKQQEIAI